MKWLQKSANAGDAIAMSEAGKRFAQGVGTTKNDDTAAQYFVGAAYEGDARGMFNLAVVMERRWFFRLVLSRRDPAATWHWYKISLSPGEFNLALFFLL